MKKPPMPVDLRDQRAKLRDPGATSHATGFALYRAHRFGSGDAAPPRSRGLARANQHAATWHRQVLRALSAAEIASGREFLM
jgi:hypothetical protein